MSISSIVELASIITEHLKNDKNLRDLKDILQEYNGIDWKDHICENNCRYNRCSVFKNEQIDIYIITWVSKQHSMIHDHPLAGCLVKVLEGQLTEEVYVKMNDEFINTKTNTFDIHNIGFQIGKAGLHKILNNEDVRAVSLHIYSPSGYVPHCYDKH